MNDDYIQNLINQLETATKEQVIYFAQYVSCVGYIRHELWGALCKAMDKYEINYQPMVSHSYKITEDDLSQNDRVCQ